MKIRKLIVGGFLLGCFVVACSGCVPGDPRTRFRLDLARGTADLDDTKDNRLAFDSLEVDPNTGKVDIKGFAFGNIASDVTTAQVAKLEMINQQMAIHGANISNALGQLTGLVSIAAPMVTGRTGPVYTPNLVYQTPPQYTPTQISGGTVTTAPAEDSAISEFLGLVKTIAGNGQVDTATRTNQILNLCKNTPGCPWTKVQEILGGMLTPSVGPPAPE